MRVAQSPDEGRYEQPEGVQIAEFDVFLFVFDEVDEFVEQKRAGETGTVRDETEEPNDVELEPEATVKRNEKRDFRRFDVVE